MCLAIPSKIVSIDDIMATVDVHGARRDISEAVSTGDYVLVHAGFAIQKVSQEVAEEAHRLLREMAEKLQDAEERGEDIFF
jgi:hydrogenase expression/formation protein HypC